MSVRIMGPVSPGIRRRSAYLVQQTVPAGAREEVCHYRYSVSQRRAQTVLLVVLAIRFVRPVDHQRLALDVIALQVSPVTAVLGVVAVVAHHEVLPLWDRDGAVLLALVEGGELLVVRSRRQQVVDVWLV